MAICHFQSDTWNGKGNGIFTLRSKCKCYTLSTILIATSNQIANFTNDVPTVDITVDECCLEQQELLMTEEMEPIKLSDVNFNDLNHANSKLKQFNEELDRRMNQPFPTIRLKGSCKALVCINSHNNLSHISLQSYDYDQPQRKHWVHFSKPTEFTNPLYARPPIAAVDETIQSLPAPAPLQEYEEINLEEPARRVTRCSSKNTLKM
ncbi:hypothetical protein HUJ05_002189 [Dendroctonus ponderosae]|nr:hypothetical protein HUJ05_002189 [Dendroctonus ponderosae]